MVNRVHGWYSTFDFRKASSEKESVSKPERDAQDIDPYNDGMDEMPTETQLRERIGERIRLAREAMGIDQETFGTALGVSGGTQSKYESGISRPRWRYLWLLESRFRIPLTYLWSGELRGLSQELQKRLKSR